MPRKRKSTHQKPVSNHNAELSGSAKRSRSAKIKKEDNKLRLESAKVFKKWSEDGLKQKQTNDVPLTVKESSEEEDINMEESSSSDDDEENESQVSLANERSDDQSSDNCPDDEQQVNENEVEACEIEDERIGQFGTPADESTLSSSMVCSDPSTWPKVLDAAVKTDLLKSEMDLEKEYGAASNDIYKFLKKYVNGTKANGEGFKREWIRVSPISNSVYCLPCSVFANGKTSWSSSGAGNVGFRDFNHAWRGVPMHENSASHIESTRLWKLHLLESKVSSKLATDLDLKIHIQVNEWRLILRGILDAIMYLAQHNLAFQGESKSIIDFNSGNFLGLIKLLSKYYDPLAKHIARLEYKKTSYLSPQIQNEFIQLCGSAVKKQILDQIRKRKYFSIMLDSTPDVSKCDQISEIIRTVNCNDVNCKIEENFIDFFICHDKTGAGITQAILEKLKEDNLEIMNCRGQGYDNGANMAGCYQGVQARLLKENATARFVPCAAHSLNLVGANAVEKVREGRLVLGEIQTLYLFFASSTSRWDILKRFCKVSLKNQSGTRWSAKADAVGVIWSNFGKIVAALEEIADNEMFSAEVTVAAEGRIVVMKSFKFLLGLFIWNTILFQINQCNLFLQQKQTDVSAATKRLEALCKWLENFQKNGFEESLKSCKVIALQHQISENSGFETARRGRGVNPRYHDEATVASAKENDNLERFRLEYFENVMKVLLDEIRKRFLKMKEANADFDFLWGNLLQTLSRSEQEKCVQDLCLKYPEDFDCVAFSNEIQSFKVTVETFLPNEQKLEKSKPLDILNVLHQNGLASTYSNCETALRIFLTLPVSVATNERAFSKMKLIKTYLRSSMGQERMSSLAILSIERECSATLDFDAIITEFAETKCRRIKFT